MAHAQFSSSDQNPRNGKLTQIDSAAAEFPQEPSLANFWDTTTISLIQNQTTS